MASNWFQGCEGGSPGKAYSPCPVLPDGAFAWLYPNPSSNEINISVDNTLTGNSGTTVEVFDLSGQLVIKQAFTPIVETVEPITMDISSLRASMYLVRISKAGQTMTLPLMKN